MKPDARLRLNSVGKTWTATLILRLVGEGRMKLDDTVSQWLPGLLPYGNQITVAQLLSMTSGMIDTNDLYAKPAYYVSRIKDPALLARVVAAFRRARSDPTYPPTRAWIEAAAGVGLLYQPGSTWHYSNIGYMVLGLIAARVGDADLATLFRTQIIDPLHLQSARYDPAPNISGPHAHGYSPSTDGKLVDATGWTGGLAANGGIVSDTADEAHFLQALMQRARPAACAARGARNPIRTGRARARRRELRPRRRDPTGRLRHTRLRLRAQWRGRRLHVLRAGLARWQSGGGRAHQRLRREQRAPGPGERDAVQRDAAPLLRTMSPPNRYASSHDRAARQHADIARTRARKTSTAV